MVRHLIVLLAFCLSWATPAAFASTLYGKVISVADGDTVTLLDADNTSHRIRLAQIDAPEVEHGEGKPSQPYGQVSKRALASLVHGKEVRAECAAFDRKYGRPVCQIWLGDIDVNLEQVRNGLAWVYRQYATDRRYFAAEEDARLQRKGIWNDVAPLAPWLWRKQ